MARQIGVLIIPSESEVWQKQAADLHIADLVEKHFGYHDPDTSILPVGLARPAENYVLPYSMEQWLDQMDTVLLFRSAMEEDIMPYAPFLDRNPDKCLLLNTALQGDPERAHLTSWLEVKHLLQKG